MPRKADSIRSYPIPNVRKLITPDNGCEIASIDLSGADAQTVAWESDDADLKAAFRAGVKIHAHNAKVMFKGRAITGFEQPYYDLCRTGCHLVNYVGGIDELAHAMGFSRSEAKEFRDYWFQLHPGIPRWHARIEDQLQRTRTVTNKFGYRRFYFDRIEGILPEAIAWIGQSHTACVCNRAIDRLEAWENITWGMASKEDFEPWVIESSREVLDLGFELLSQVHDELVFQYPVLNRDRLLSTVYRLVHLPIPYDDPLVISWGLKTSQKSWGECEKRDWPKREEVCQSATTMTG